MTKYNNVSLTDKERDDLLEIGNRVLAPYGVTVTLPAVIRYMIHQQRALHKVSDKAAYEALHNLKESDLDD